MSSNDWLQQLKAHTRYVLERRKEIEEKEKQIERKRNKELYNSRIFDEDMSKSMNYSRARELEEAHDLRILEIQNREEERKNRILAEREMIKAENQEKAQLKQIRIDEARRKKEESEELRRKELEMKILEKDYQKMLYVQKIKDLRESMRLQAAQERRERIELERQRKHELDVKNILSSKGTASPKTTPHSIKRTRSKSLSSSQQFSFTPTFGGWTGNKSSLQTNLPTLQNEGSKLIVDKEEFELDSVRNARTYDELKSLCNEIMKKYLLKETLKESERQQLLKKSGTLAEKQRLQNILDIERAHARKKLLELNAKLDEIKQSRKMEEF